MLDKGFLSTQMISGAFPIGLNLLRQKWTNVTTFSLICARITRRRRSASGASAMTYAHPHTSKFFSPTFQSYNQAKHAAEKNFFPAAAALVV
jgi:hypothetical protein